MGFPAKERAKGEIKFCSECELALQCLKVLKSWSEMWMESNNNVT
jgi:hypothetical protein